MSAASIADLPKIRRALLAWHRRQGMHAPWRDSGDPYQALVAAVMAQQTQMSRVMPSYERFVAAFPTIGALAAASAGDVIRVWAGMGYNQRAIRLHRAARTIVEGGWPQDAASLARIDGIGPFTAAIIASFAFSEPAACVDTNVRRVLGRLCGDEGIDRKRLQSLADAALVVREPARWNQALMDYGARVCAVRPKCGECVVSGWCPSRRDRPATASTSPPRLQPTSVPVSHARAVGAQRVARQSAVRPALRVADDRAAYIGAARPKAVRSKFEGSTRWWRGRIVAALSALPPGAAITIAALRRALASSGEPPAGAGLEALVAALEAHGLVVKKGNRVALPD